MATIQDIFDWLNQGAQGDIPGTGGSEPNQPTSQPSAEPQPTPGGQAQPSPADYAGDIHPSLLPHYHALVQAGLPPQMAHHILTQPSAGEEKKGQQGNEAYKAGQEGMTGILHGLFGAPPSQQEGQAQDHQGIIDMLSNWFSPQQQDAP